MRLNCPHCKNPIEVVEEQTEHEVVCPSCGSSFELEPDTTSAWSPDDGERKLGKFLLVDVIGVGAHGTVYMARDTELDRVVALKIPRSGELSSKVARDRFFREARSVAQLTHASIVPVYDFGESDEIPFLVSEYISGITLSDELSARSLPFRESAKLIRTVAEALHYAHQQGVVHRDVKPSNIILDHETREPRLMDFGLAKRDAGEITMTMDGQVLGTPAYMSPEQAAGGAHRVDGKSDVYSLGVVLYELLTGELPFRGTSRMLIHQVLQDEPRPPRRINDHIPRDLETICLKAMAKEPSRRYQSAKELSLDLNRWLNNEPIKARPVGQLEKTWRWAKRNPTVASLGSAVFALLFLVAIVATYAAYQINQSRLETLETQRNRVLDQVDNLLDVNAAAVPTIIESFEPHREWVNPKLNDLLKEDPPPAKKRRLYLALLPEQPELADRLSQELLEADAREYLLIRDAISSQKSKFLEDLWDEAESEETTDSRRFRAACALASYAPDDARWKEIANSVADHLVGENPLFLETWKTALEPVSDNLSQHLRRISQDSDRSETERIVATNTLAEYSADDPAQIADFLMSATVIQYPVFFEELEKLQTDAIPVLGAELQKEPQSAFRSAQKKRIAKAAPVTEELKEQIQGLEGLIDEKFVLCQKMTQTELEKLNEDLQQHQYDPIRIRPYTIGDDVRFAAIWDRSVVSGEYEISLGVSQEKFKSLEATNQQRGYVPIDVAGYIDPSDMEDSKVIYCGVWYKSEEDQPERKLIAGVPRAEAKQIFEDAETNGLIPRIQNTVALPDGTSLVNAILTKSSTSTESTIISENEGRPPETVSSRVYREVTFRRSVPITDYRRNLLAATETLHENPDDQSSRLKRIEAAYYLGENAQVLEDVAHLNDKGATEIGRDTYFYRAMAYARLGDFADARQDLVSYSLSLLSDPEASWRKLVLAALIDACAEKDSISEYRIESLLEENSNNLELAYRSATLYSILAQQSADTDPESSNRYLDRAKELLRQCASEEPAWRGRVRVDPALAMLRQDLAFMEQIWKNGRLFDALWYLDNQAFESIVISDLSPHSHRQASAELESKGYEPISISIAHTPTIGLDLNDRSCTSVWWRPVVSAAEKTELAKRKANAASTLLALGHTESVWPLFKHSPDPTIRSQLVHQLAQLEVDPSLLIKRLRNEQDVSIRRVLILALGEYDDGQLPEPVRNELVPELLDFYSHDPDPGVHSAVQWLLTQWEKEEQLKEAEAELDIHKLSSTRRWYRTSEGHPMAIIEGPVEFTMGSPPQEPGRYTNETLHRRKIPRSFAIATEEIMGAQLLHFVEDNPEINLAVGTIDMERSPKLPGQGLMWLETAMYCRWLSEIEGVPEDQMCYPPISQINYGTELPPDYLSRTGYRLPTEAEWEYACRAGTNTTRFYGESTELLEKYVWYSQSSNLDVQRSGRLKPNDFGMFDILGNVEEQCLDMFDGYLSDSKRQVIVDHETMTKLTTDLRPITRGGTAYWGGIHIRSARRSSDSSLRTLGGNKAIRLARTLPLFRLQNRHLLASEEASLEVEGWGTPFVIENIHGTVQVEPRKGISPLTVKVRGKDNERGEFSFNLRRTDTAEVFPITGNLSPPWNLEFYEYQWGQDDWNSVIASKPLKETTTSLLDYQWAPEDSPEDDVPASGYGLVASKELELNGGKYLIRTKANDGVRVLIDGKTVIDSWEPRLLDLADEQKVELEAGKHEIRVEYFRGGGAGALEFNIQPLADESQSPHAP